MVGANHPPLLLMFARQLAAKMVIQVAQLLITKQSQVLVDPWLIINQNLFPQKMAIPKGLPIPSIHFQGGEN